MREPLRDMGSTFWAVLSKNTKLYLLFFVAWFIIVYVMYYYYVNEPFTNRRTIPDSDIELVVSRYDEDLSWLNDPLFSSYRATVYNKGPKMDNSYAGNIARVLDLENVGRESHSYLFHILNNYDNLAEYTVFLPGSTFSKHYKYEMAEETINKMHREQATAFAFDNADGKTMHYDFVYEGGGRLPAPIQPLGKWCEQRLGSRTSGNKSWYGVFSVKKEDILVNPKSFYETLIADLSTHPDPEVGHYFERLWGPIFTGP